MAAEIESREARINYRAGRVDGLLCALRTEINALPVHEEHWRKLLNHLDCLERCVDDLELKPHLWFAREKPREAKDG